MDFDFSATKKNNKGTVTINSITLIDIEREELLGDSIEMSGGCPFVGYVREGGEPAGKNGNDKDYFELVVRHPVTNVVVFGASGELDGGNVQIHPPVPSSQ